MWSRDANILCGLFGLSTECLLGYAPGMAFPFLRGSLGAPRTFLGRLKLRLFPPTLASAPPMSVVPFVWLPLLRPWTRVLSAFNYLPTEVPGLEQAVAVFKRSLEYRCGSVAIQRALQFMLGMDMAQVGHVLREGGFGRQVPPRFAETARCAAASWYDRRFQAIHCAPGQSQAYDCFLLYQVLDQDHYHGALARQLFQMNREQAVNPLHHQPFLGGTLADAPVREQLLNGWAIDPLSAFALVKQQIHAGMVALAGGESALRAAALEAQQVSGNPERYGQTAYAQYLHQAAKRFEAVQGAARVVPLTEARMPVVLGVGGKEGQAFPDSIPQLRPTTAILQREEKDRVIVSRD